MADTLNAGIANGTIILKDEDEDEDEDDRNFDFDYAEVPDGKHFIIPFLPL